MVSTTNNTRFETSQPTQTADLSAPNEQNSDPFEHIKYETRQQLTVLLQEFNEYSESLSPEQIVTQYGTTLEPLTFKLGAQLLLKEPTEKGTAESLHPPTIEDVEFFFECHDAAVEVMKAKETIDPLHSDTIEKDISLLHNLVGQAIDEIETDDIETIRAMNLALDLAEEREQGVKKSYEEILAGKAVAMSLDELLETDSDVTYDTYFPYVYAKKLLFDREDNAIPAEDITIEAAVERAAEIAAENPAIADNALNNLSASVADRDPSQALSIAERISSSSLKAIRLSDILRTGSSLLEPAAAETTRQTINGLIGDVIANQNPRQRAFAIAEIAANLGEDTTIRGAKEYITHLTQTADDMTLNIPIEALFAAMDNTNSINEWTGARRSFTRALTNELNELHAQDDVERAKHQDEAIPLVPEHRIRELAVAHKQELLRKMPLHRRIGTTLFNLI